MKILIIAEFFPPLNNIASGRPLSWAKYLSENNDVTVLTVKKESVDGSLDYEFSNNLYNLIEIERLNKKKELDFINKLGWIFKAYYKVRKDKWDVVISTSNPWQVHFLGYILKRLNKVSCWIADYRDLWSENFHTIAKVGIRHKIHTFIETRIIKRADIITTVSEPLKVDIQKMFPDKPIDVVFNGFEGEPIEKITYKPKDKLIFVHSGTIYEGKRNPTPIFRAIKELIEDGELNENQVEIRFLGSRLGNLKELIKKERAEGFVKLLGQVSRELSIQEQQKANFLLLLESSDEKTKGVLTGKLFEYLVARTPIISIGPLLNFSSSAIIKQTRTGVVCENNIAIIKEVILNEKDGNTKYTPDFDEISKYSRSEQAKKIGRIIYNFFYER